MKFLNEIHVPSYPVKVWVCVWFVIVFICLPKQVRDVDAMVRRFKTDLHNCVGYIQDPKILKESIKALYQKHVQEDIVRMPCFSHIFVGLTMSFD